MKLKIKRVSGYIYLDNVYDKNGKLIAKIEGNRGIGTTHVLKFPDNNYDMIFKEDGPKMFSSKEEALKYLKNKLK